MMLDGFSGDQFANALSFCDSIWESNSCGIFALASEIARLSVNAAKQTIEIGVFGFSDVALVVKTEVTGMAVMSCGFKRSTQHRR